MGGILQQFPMQFGNAKIACLKVRFTVDKTTKTSVRVFVTLLLLKLAVLVVVMMMVMVVAVEMFAVWWPD